MDSTCLLWTIPQAVCPAQTYVPQDIHTDADLFQYRKRYALRKYPVLMLRLPHVSFNTASGMPCANETALALLDVFEVSIPQAVCPAQIRIVSRETEARGPLFQYRKRYALRKSCTLEALVSVG